MNRIEYDMYTVCIYSTAHPSSDVALPVTGAFPYEKRKTTRLLRVDKALSGWSNTVTGEQIRGGGGGGFQRGEFLA